ncbi:MAG: asparagine synthase [Chloroflexi bacterium AL-W]|nr:asparagine synthase [Chloroflexi bacterium AL-N1]NOK65967.1 asparagine synthase [Chloroflexi bacterium AL-N10]NOK72848.1 asparagine synthase [Chloroflexi bacterium AL-N5]NOK79745.1 asparagine synthase [Chloroflexi bacterium AL-W]NOK88399.1 asparagine synthase [Chloroflexi bacterium AL-N15]
MPRFCAVLEPHASDVDIFQMGGESAYCDTHCALGILPNECPAVVAGLYQYDSSSAQLMAVGEVTLYNRDEVLRHLDGHHTHGSDGDLLLRLYAQKGVAAFTLAVGMFVLAIWDGASLLLVRDPVGARTLFYTRVGETWAAASALRALRRWPRLPVQLNLAAVRSFLTFAYLPGDETLLEGVLEVLPGCVVHLTLGNDAALLNYWEPHEQPWDGDAPPDMYTSHLRQLLEQVVQSHLPSNQPVGVFLSGGIDSSLVAALVAQYHDQPITTYSISFGKEYTDELAYSGLVAAHCGLPQKILTVSGQQIAANLADAVVRLDCPVGDPLTVPNMLLSQAAAADGMQIILNGEGGDPCFGGPKNLPMVLYELQRTDPDPMARAQAYLVSYRKCYEDLPMLLTQDALDDLCDAPPLERFVQPYLECDSMQHYLNRLLYCNVRTKGAHHILTKVERLTASCGLEGRSPLFDQRIVDYAFAIPPTLKLVGTNEKWVLKEAVRDLLPGTIIDRPKSGMRVPVQHWLHGPIRVLAQELLFGPQARARGLFRRDTLKLWLNGRGSVWSRQGAKLWLVLTLELWLRAYLDNDEEPLEFAHPRRLWRGW